MKLCVWVFNCVCERWICTCERWNCACEWWNCVCERWIVRVSVELCVRAVNLCVCCCLCLIVCVSGEIVRVSVELCVWVLNCVCDRWILTILFLQLTEIGTSVMSKVGAPVSKKIEQEERRWLFCNNIPHITLLITPLSSFSRYQHDTYPWPTHDLVTWSLDLLCQHTTLTYPWPT